jgi:outer membrane protein
MKLSIVILVALLSSINSFSQTDTVKKWSLRECVEYAFQNNITIRRADLDTKFAELDLEAEKLSQYGRVGFQGDLSYNAGRNQNPTTYNLTTETYFFNGYSLQASADIFNWFSKKNTIAARDLDYQASKAGLSKAKDDVALNIAVAYLQVLLNKEQVELSKVKIGLTLAELINTRKQVDAGKLPALNAVNLESVLALDSSSLITAETNVQRSLLQMKAILNMDAGTPFDVITPPVHMIPVESLADLQPDKVYLLATQAMPQQVVDSLTVQAARKYADAARGMMYPTISLFGGLGSAFNNKNKQIVSVTQVNDPIGTVDVSGTNYLVYPSSPILDFKTGPFPYFDQLNTNFNQSVGISISVPIFNGGSLKTAYKRAKLNINQAELTMQLNGLTLKQDIYNAYNDAVAAYQQFNANKKAVDASETAYSYASKRYELGLISSFELISTQTTLAEARSRYVYAQYDYVFKIKLLEFYKGQGLKL